jgi:hypothetical protein
MSYENRFTGVAALVLGTLLGTCGAMLPTATAAHTLIDSSVPCGRHSILS